MTHEELHNGIPIRTEHSEDAVFIASMLADGFNACVEGDKHVIAKMFAKLFLHNPALLLMIKEAMDLAMAEIDNKEFPPELN